MPRAYSIDLRERGVASVLSGDRAVGVSVAPVGKWSQRFRAKGSAAPKPAGGKRPLRLTASLDWLGGRIGRPGVTLRSLVAELSGRAGFARATARRRSAGRTRRRQ